MPCMFNFLFRAILICDLTARSGASGTCCGARCGNWRLKVSARQGRAADAAKNGAKTELSCGDGTKKKHENEEKGGDREKYC